MQHKPKRTMEDIETMAYVYHLHTLHCMLCKDSLHKSKINSDHLNVEVFNTRTDSVACERKGKR